jgi:hypothetical protein
MQKLIKYLLIGVLATATSCVERTEPAGLEALENSLASSGGGTSVGLPSSPAFDIQARVVGRLVPGAKLQVIATVRSLTTLQTSEITIVAPDMQDAAATGWGESFRASVGRPFAANARTTGTISKGSVRQIEAELAAERPGYYRVIVGAKTKDEGLPFGTHTAVYKDLWLLITEEGGIITDSLETARIPRGRFVQPGPWRSGWANGASQMQEAVSASVMPGTHDYHKLLYYNNDTFANVPLPYAEVEFRVHTYIDGSPVETNVISYSTASTGDVTFPCMYVPPGDYYDMYVTWFSANARLVNAKTYVLTAFGDICGSYYTSSSPGVSVMNSYQAHVLKRISEIQPLTQGLFGKTRSLPQALVWGSTGTSFYDDEDDVMNIKQNGVFTPFGEFTIAHEFGHAFHEDQLGGSDADSSGCPSPHHLDQLVSMRCAFAEGFAHYFATRVGYTANLDWEGTDYTYGCTAYSGLNCVTHTSTRDGSRTEAAVAQVLYDLTDAPIEAHDSLSYPGSYIADLITTCVVNSNEGTKVRSIDVMVYCLETQIDATIKANYFPTRVGTLIFSSESATEPSGWSVARLRKVWKHNLYGQ